MNDTPETVNDDNRDQVAALLGWMKTPGGWYTPDGRFFCHCPNGTHPGDGARAAALGVGLARLRARMERDAALGSRKGSR